MRGRYVLAEYKLKYKYDRVSSLLVLLLLER